MMFFQNQTKGMKLKKRERTVYQGNQRMRQRRRHKEHSVVEIKYKDFGIREFKFNRENTTCAGTTEGEERRIR